MCRTMHLRTATSSSPLPTPAILLPRSSSIFALGHKGTDMIRTVFFSTAAALAVFIAAGAANAGGLPAGTRDRKLTLHLEDANATNVYRLITDVGGMNVALDACFAQSK